jgi:hypothetical protein
LYLISVVVAVPMIFTTWNFSESTVQVAAIFSPTDNKNALSLIT